jgi:hypothetical protein
MPAVIGVLSATFRAAPLTGIVQAWHPRELAGGAQGEG